MAFTLEDLLPGDQQLWTIQPHEPVGHAINIMCQQRYDQLPVIGPNSEFLGQVITFESILRAVQAFRTDAENLLVRDAAQRARSYPSDADLLETLDDIHRDNFALISDGAQLIGIVTTADVATYFRDYAEDLLQIEGIESRLKDAIRALYASNEAALDSAIAAVTDRAAEVRKKLPGAIKAYLNKVSVNFAPAANEEEALAEAWKRLGLPESAKKFDDLTFDQYTNVLLRHPRAPRLSQAEDAAEIRKLLEQVRDARNRLAHFRGELDSEQRRMVKFAAEWLENNLPEPLPEAVSTEPGTPGLLPQHDERDGPSGSYAPLSAYLQSLTPDKPSVTLSFQQIEAILKKELPRSASEYRAWWANVPTKPQSAAWLDEGWRTSSVNMRERRLSFVRTNEREQAYIRFFSHLKARLATEADFPLRDGSPQGQCWHVLASLNGSAAEGATIGASFARRKRFRVELYLDGGDKDENKRRFDQLMAHKSEIETSFGEPLEWERIDSKRACRVAAYTKGQILTDVDNQTLIDWAARRAVRLYRAFLLEFQTGGGVAWAKLVASAPG